MYVQQIRDGAIKPKTKSRIARNGASTALLDAKWGVGQPTCIRAMNMAIEKARKNGVGSVGIYNCNHIGRLGDYVMMAVERNMIGIVFANSDPSVAPFGGMSRVLGANPMSFGIPAGKEKPVIVDFASSVTAEGKIRAAFLKGKSVPENWILDSEGRPTTNPGDFYGPPYPPHGVNVIGAQLPAGGHKGFALGMIVDILGGALTGSGCGSDMKVGNGVFVQAIDVKRFVPIGKFRSTVDKLIREIKTSPKAEGVTEILVPGEPEFRAREERIKSGIAIPDAIWSGIIDVAAKLKVDLDRIIANPEP
jgi:uncharacterized oxidoreductase